MDVAQLGLAVDSSGVSKATEDLNRLTNAAKVAENAVAGLSSKQNSARAALAAAKGYQSQSASALAAARASGTASQEDIKAAQAALQKARAVTAAARADLDSVGASLAAAKADQQQAGAALKAAQAMNQATAAANDNVARVGGNVQRMGGSMSGLAAQFQDIGVTAAMGMNPMMIALQQGTQIAGQMEMAMQSGASASAVFAQSFRSLLSPVTFVTIALTALAAAGLQMVDWTGLAASALIGLADILQTIAPYATMAAAGLALLYAPAIIGGIIGLIGLLGQLSVAALGLAASFAAANPAVAFVLGITAAVAAANVFRDELTRIFGFDIVGAAKDGVNKIIGAFVGGYQGLKAVWSALPAALGDIVYATANAVIKGVENMVNRVGAKLSEWISSVYNGISGLASKVGIDMGTFKGIPEVKFGGVANPYAGAADAAQSAVGSAISDAMGTDYVGQLGTAITNAASAGAEKLKELAGSLTNVEAAAGKAGGAGKKAGDDFVNGFDGAKAAIERAREILDFAKDTARGFVDDFVSGLANGEGAWKSFANAALNALSKIADRLLDSAFDSIFSFGGLFGGLGGLSQLDIASAGGIGMYASGTASARAGVAMVGERGPELVRFGGGESVIPNHQLRAANSNRGGGGPQKVTFDMNVTVSGNGDKELMGRMQKAAEQSVRQGLEQYRRFGVQDDIKSYSEDKWARG